MARVFGVFALLVAGDSASIHVRVDGDALVAETLREYASVDLDWWPDTGLGGRGSRADPASPPRAGRQPSRLDSPRLRFVARLIMSSRRTRGSTLHPTGLNRAAGAAPRVENDGARARREAVGGSPSCRSALGEPELGGDGAWVGVDVDARGVDVGGGVGR